MRTESVIDGLTSWDFKVVLSVSITLATASILLFVYDIGYANGYGAGPYGSAVSDYDFFFWLSRLHLGIAAGLIIAAVGLWSRRVAGVLLSAAGLAWVAVVYAWWYLETKAYVAHSEVTQQTKLHDPYYRNITLHGGTWWDWTVLSVVLLILVWLTVAMRKALRKRSKLTEGR